MKQLLSLIILSLFLGNAIAQKVQFSSIDGGHAPHHHQGPCIHNDHRQEIKARLSENISKLRKEGNSLISNKNRITKFNTPLDKNESLKWNGYIAISNYIDHDPEARGEQYGSSNLDYDCGNRSYDLDDGYNHQGIDYFSWPFSWYLMETDQVHVVAAADGVIIGKDDGNEDDHCEPEGSWNAVYVRHNDGSIAWYGHLKRNSLTSLEVGDNILSGDYIGVVGSSGQSTGPHLHLEIYDANDNLIDPFQGNCNSLNDESWWEDQEEYRVPTLNAIMTHGQPPEFGCIDEEQTRVKDQFQAGETVFFAAYYRDQEEGAISSFIVRRPDGSVYNDWIHESPDTYNASYWLWSFPVSSDNGLWSYEVEFEGQIVEHEFRVGASPIADNDGDGFDETIDCDDNNPAVYPGATEICNGIDDNCNMQIDEINCSSDEICNNGIDDDGDGLIDCDDPDIADLFCCITDPCNEAVDRDMDGVGDACDEDDDNDGILDIDECPPARLEITPDDEWTPVNNGDTINVQIGDVFIIPNHYTDSSGKVYDLRFELESTYSSDSIVDYEVKLNPSICLNGGRPSQDDHIVYNIGWVESGSVTSADLTGVPAMFDWTQITINDLDNNNTGYTDVGGFVNTVYNFEPGSNIEGYILGNGQEVFGIRDYSFIQSNCSGCTISGELLPFSNVSLIHGVTGDLDFRTNRLASWEFRVGNCRDSDGDGTPDYLDTDSDDDGCIDALEGGDNFVDSDTELGMLVGDVDPETGIPILAGDGQSVNTSINSNSQDGCLVDEICGNGIDDDGDGLIDCDDPDLFSDCCCFQPSPININASSINFCPGTSVSLSVNQAYEIYAWNTGENTSSISVSSAGTYTITVTDRCDGTQTAMITVFEFPVVPESQEYEICGGEEIEVNGTVYNMAGTYTQNTVTAEGCNNTLTILINELPTNVTNESYSICEGESIELYGQTYTTSGTYTITQPNPNGCDNVININITVVPTEDELIDARICEGDEYVFDGQNLTQAGMYTMTETGTGGCESTTTLTLSVDQATSEILDLSICEGEELDVNGQTYATAGSYTQNLTNVAGCDSTLTIVLDVEQSVTITENYNLTSGGSVTVNGEIYTMGGQYIQTITTGDCDTTLIINITERTSLVYFDFDACSANVGLDNFDYSEFIPRIADINCGVISSSTVYRSNPLVNIHSCTPGINGSLSMCISSEEGCDYVDNSDKAARISITVTPNAGESILLSGFSFSQKAPMMFDWINGPSMLNNYPRLFGVRVLVNGTEVLKETGLATTFDWRESSFEFGADGLTVTENSVVTMEFLGYCVIGNGQDVTAWDLEDVNIYGACDNSSNLVVSGNIKTEYDQIVESVKVYNTGDHGQAVTEIDIFGDYAFMNNSPNGYYEISAYKNDDQLNGVSTQDLLAIQRHILAIEPITDPTLLLAADINNDDRINGIDLIELRKLILGVYKELPQNTSYKFVEKKGLEFNQEAWQLSESIRYRGLSSHVFDADFVAIKIGDVNGSAEYSEGLTNRSSDIPFGSYKISKDEVSISSQEDFLVEGIQVSLQLVTDGNGVTVTSDQLDISTDDYFYDQESGILLISYLDVNQFDLMSGKPLFNIEAKGIEVIGVSTTIESEVYVDGTVRQIRLADESALRSESDLRVFPNPFSETAIINFFNPEEGNVTVSVVNTIGQQVWYKNINAHAGTNRLALNKSDLSGTGVFTVVLNSTKSGRLTERIVLTN